MLKNHAVVTTPAQGSALTRLIEKLEEVRGFRKPEYTTKINPVSLQVFLKLPDFPEIDVGRDGGFSMPHIRSYKEGKRDTFTYPGNTAFDACLFGDEHVQKQHCGAWTDAWFAQCI